MTEVGDDEQALLATWRAGDARAGQVLFRRHYVGLSRFFRSKAGDAAFELAQATFLACVEARGAIRGASSFRAYPYGVARNILYDHYRDKSRTRETLEFGEVRVHHPHRLQQLRDLLVVDSVGVEHGPLAAAACPDGAAALAGVWDSPTSPRPPAPPRASAHPRRDRRPLRPPRRRPRPRDRDRRRPRRRRPPPAPSCSPRPTSAAPPPSRRSPAPPRRSPPRPPPSRSSSARSPGTTRASPPPSPSSPPPNPPPPATPTLALAHLDRADAILTRCSDPDLPARALLRFDRARLLAASRTDEVRGLATDALAVLRAAGDGFSSEATTVAAWLARR